MASRVLPVGVLPKESIPQEVASFRFQSIGDEGHLRCPLSGVSKGTWGVVSRRRLVRWPQEEGGGFGVGISGPAFISKAAPSPLTLSQLSGFLPSPLHLLPGQLDLEGNC